MLLSETDQNDPDSSEKVKYRTRKGYIAFLLSVCPGMGQQYAGHLYRGIAAYAGLVSLSWLSAIVYMYADSRYIGLTILALPFLSAFVISVDAVICALKQRQDYPLKWYNRYWLYLIIFTFLVFTVNPVMDAVVGRHIVRAFFVTSESMSPTVLLHDLVVINKLAIPKKGNIVLIDFAERSHDGAISKIIHNQTLRRIVAVEGDEVEMRGDRVYINGELQREPYLSRGDSGSPNSFMHEEYRWGPKKVKKGEFFVLSDARQYTFDSRMLGVISASNIKGVATKVFWSWNLNEGKLKWERTAMTIL